MERDSVCLVAYLDQDNLGVGYIASSLLRTEHFDITLVDIRETVREIIRGIDDAAPLIIGFSIVFQGQLDAFKELMVLLRQSGMNCHFTAGGHYPSLRYEELMRIVPELDSIVLFEGEHTMVELAETIQNNGQWRDVDGIAYRADGAIKCNTLRPLEDDLDRLPLPIRRPIRPKILGRKVANRDGLDL